MKTFQDFSPYNALYWAPNGSRSKRQFQYKLQTVERALNDSRRGIRVLSSETMADPNFIPLTHNLDTSCPSDMGPSAKKDCVRPAVEEIEDKDDNDENKDEDHSAPQAKGPTKKGKPAARLTTWKKT